MRSLIRSIAIGSSDPGGRSRMAAELSDALRQTSLAAIRQRHPEYSEDEVRGTFVRVLYQIDMAR
jgi:hypothetical protein